MTLVNVVCLAQTLRVPLEPGARQQRRLANVHHHHHNNNLAVSNNSRFEDGPSPRNPTHGHAVRNKLPPLEHPLSPSRPP